MVGRDDAPAACRRRLVQRLRRVTVPGELVVTAIAAPGSTRAAAPGSSSSRAARIAGGSPTGSVSPRRRWPPRRRRLSRARARTRATRADDRRSSSTYRYPEDPRGFGVPRVLSGPEQVFRVSLRKRVANFGVAVTGGRLDVQPRVVRAGDENRLLGEVALPYNANPYTTGFGRPMPVVGRGASGSGRLRHRLRHAQRLARRPVHVPLLDRRHDTSAAEVPVRARRRRQGPRTRRRSRGSIRARSGSSSTGVRRSARYDARRRLIVTHGRKLARGRHRLRLVVSDYQELKNMENVRRILPEHGAAPAPRSSFASGGRGSFVRSSAAGTQVALDARSELVGVVLVASS